MQFALASTDASAEVSIAVRDSIHCGIPKVRFLGTLQDWKNLKKKITYLDRYGCHKWNDALLPVINKFIAAIQIGEVDKDFWDAAYSVVPTKSETAKNKVNGWVCNFFPYIGEQLKDQFSHLASLKKMFRERGNKYATFMMDEADFSRGVQIQKLNVNKKEYTLASGFVGVEFLNEVMDPKYPDEFLQYVKPAVGWFLYEADPNQSKVDDPKAFRFMV